MKKNKNDIKDTLSDIGDALKKDANQTKEDMENVASKIKPGHDKDK